MNLWFISWRNLMRRKFRTFVTFMSIVIGVASTFAVIAAVDSAEKAFPIYVKEAFGKADFYINGSDAYFSEDILSEVEKLDDIAAVAVLKENTKLHLENEEISAIQKRVVLSGYSNLNTPLTNFKVIKGDLTSGGAIITDRTAKVWNIDVGDTISFETDKGLKSIEVAAIVKYTVELMGPSNWMMAKYHYWSVAMPLDLVQDWFDLSGKVESVQVKAINGANLQVVEQEIDDFIKRYDEIYMQPVIIDMDKDYRGINTFFLALYIAGFLGIALSAFIIFNSLFVSIKERKNEFAALKTIGYTPEQLQAMVLSEVMLLSIIGTAIGLILGYGLGLLLKSLIFMLFSVYEDGGIMVAKGMIISTIAGILVPIIAALYPIRQAGKVSVIEVLKENQAAKPFRNKWLGIVGVLLIISGFFIKHLLLIVPVMLGIILVFPYLINVFNRILHPLYKLLFGFVGDMAARNLRRNLIRTSMTSVILCLGIAMIVLMSSLNSALLQSYERIIFSSYGGNLDVMFHHIEEEDVELLKEIDAVADATTYPSYLGIWSLDDKKRRLPIYGVGEEWIDRFPLFITSGPSPSEIISPLKNDEIVLDQIAYDVWGGEIGETILLETIHGTQAFKVVAVVDTMKNSGYGAFMKKDHFIVNFGQKYERNALVIKDENASPIELRERIFDQFGERVEEMFGPEDWVTVIGATYTGSFAMINTLVILSMIVAGMGITNTLLINIMERVREIGMMRAVGITRGQIIRMILLEGFAIGFAATLIGCLFGIMLIYITSTFLSINSLTFDFGISWNILQYTVIFGVVISLVSSFAPASKAAKIKLMEALRYE